MSNAKYSVTKKDAKAICVKLFQSTGSAHMPCFEQIEDELRELGYQNSARCVSELLEIAARELDYSRYVAGVGINIARQYREIRGNVRTVVGALDNLRDHCEVDDR